MTKRQKGQKDKKTKTSKDQKYFKSERNPLFQAASPLGYSTATTNTFQESRVSQQMQNSARPSVCFSQAADTGPSAASQSFAISMQG